MTTSSSQRVRVAIAGGGIASMCLARGLSKNPNLDVQIFEARPDPGEAGQAFGLARNAQIALELLDPILAKAVHAAGGVRMGPSATLFTYDGTKVGEIDTNPQQIVVGRGPFQRELQHTVPDVKIHVGKKVVRVECDADGRGAKLHLEDGTVEEADAVIGCDGLNSVVREAVLGEEHPSAKPITTPMWHTRIVVPTEEARAAFGEDYCRTQTQKGHIGDGCVLITDHHDDGRAMQLITSWATKDGKPWEQPFRQIPKEDITKELEVFGDLGKKMAEIYSKQPAIFAAAGKGHLDTPTYVKGNICLLGDAAQTFPPAQGAGAGQAIEDALALSVVLTRCSKPSEVAPSFVVYDRIRRPRRSDVARSSVEAGKFLYGKLEGVGLDVPKMQQIIADWASNVYDYDLEKMVAELRAGVGIA